MSETMHYIPNRFKRVVLLHVVKNLMPQETVRVPLLLGIHGPSGEGKTYQCEQVLAAINAKVYLISGGQLESHEAGEPAQLIRNTYLKAGHSLKMRKCKTAVVLINDIDTGVGNWGEMVQYTINRQTVFGELMHLVDYPISVENRATLRVPIIVTGNDFTKLYTPLVRAGRMTSFEWSPTLEEKTEIVHRIFPEIRSQEVEDLIVALGKPPVSFFSFLKASLLDDELWQEVEKVGILKVIDLISTGYVPDLRTCTDYHHLLKVGEQIIREGKLVNHLGGR